MAEHKLYITHIHVWQGNGGWNATLYWDDERYRDASSVRGEIRTNHGHASFSAQIDHVLSVAGQLGLVERKFDLDTSPIDSKRIGLLYWNTEHDNTPARDRGWQEKLNAERKRRGW